MLTLRKLKAFYGLFLVFGNGKIQSAWKSIMVVSGFRAPIHVKYWHRWMMPIILMAIIVKWVGVTTHLGACGSPVPVTDEYGITHVIINTNAVACYSTSKNPMEKRFDTEAEADDFIKSMPRSNEFGNSGYVEGVEKFKQVN